MQKWLSSEDVWNKIFSNYKTITCFLKLRPCISYLLLFNKSPKAQRLKTMHIYYLIVFVGQESSCGLAGSSASCFCRRLQSWACSRSVSGLIRRLNWGSIHFRWLSDRWQHWVLCWLLARDHPPVPCHIGFSQKAACIIKACKMGR